MVFETGKVIPYDPLESLETDLVIFEYGFDLEDMGHHRNTI
jgi:hypothetical protein